MNNSLREQWENIPRSRCGDVEYSPCSVILKDGKQIDNVYILPAQDYIKAWGVWPEDDSNKSHIDINQVIKIKESPNRLPVSIANKIYQVGESGMGYHIYTLIFRDGLKQTYLTGNAADFVILPEGKTMHDIVDVLPHEGRKEENKKTCPKYYWCLLGEF